MGTSQKPPVLLYIDAYDSFANNIIVLLRRLLNAKVEVIRIDEPQFSRTNQSSFFEYICQFDAVIAGPGPGTPEKAEDIGLIANLWNLPEKYTVPVLGICLGFQSLVLSHGGSIYRLENPQHGIVTHVVHSNRSIFKGIGDVRVTQYNSLAVKLDDAREYLQPLAYHRDLGTNSLILSAVCHRDPQKPHWGVQFHPESVCTNAAGAEIVRNWWQETLKWNQTHRQTKARQASVNDTSRETPRPRSATSRAPADGSSRSVSIQYKLIADNSISVDRLKDIADLTGCHLLLLESVQKAPGVPIHPETGRFTIAGFCNEETKRILYYTSNSRVEVRNGLNEILNEQGPTDLWKYLKVFLSSLNIMGRGDKESPFWGGLLGFVSYETALESIAVEGTIQCARPDVCLAFVERSIVIDNVANRIWIQSTKSEDDDWLAKVHLALTGSDEGDHAVLIEDPLPLKAANICLPEKEAYAQSVRTCKEEIRAGNSYELCLTTEGVLSLPAATTKSDHAWKLYERLRELNGAPFAAYLRFGAEGSESAVSGVSSSPERFLSWDRKGHFQFRPIKGTLKKTPGMTQEQAERYFESTKERAENLMIVDLIRHDLNGVLPFGEAQTTKLMSVEEYATVYQLVSVVEGNLSFQTEYTTGVDVLAASLPPGSMTGAPKKRSCELLREIEQNRTRGIYSGVIGYLDVGGGGDFSVAIRTAFSWDQEQRDGYDFWHIGAGGAITAQSDENAEYAEMLTKLEAVLRIFN